MTSFGEVGNYTPKPPKMGVNRHFPAKTAKYKNHTISESINPIKPKFEDKVQTINNISWVVNDYPKANPKWLTAVTAAILKIAMTS